MSWRWRHTTPNQRAGYVVGAALIVFGVLGAATGGDLLSEGTTIGPFRTNPGQGLVHTGAGALVLAIAAIGPGAARVGNVLGGLIEAGVAALAASLPVENILALDPASAGLTAPLALLLLSVALSPAFAARRDEILAPGALSGTGGTWEPMAARPRKLDRLAAIPSEGPAWRATVPEPTHRADDPPELVENLTRDALYELARELDIEGRSKMNKAELAGAVAATRRRSAPTAA